MTETIKLHKYLKELEKEYKVLQRVYKELIKGKVFRDSDNKEVYQSTIYKIGDLNN